MNVAFVIGNLGKDPELRQTQGGTPVANFSVATKKFIPGVNGAKGEEKAEWHNIIVWGDLAKSCAAYLTKGKKVGILGEISTRKWQDKTGVERYSTEITAHKVEFLSPRDDGRAPHPADTANLPQNAPTPGPDAKAYTSSGSSFVDDIPFARLNEWGM